MVVRSGKTPTGPGMKGTGFTPPPYPYERLDELRTIAEGVQGGAVDCSVGTPCDPPPAAVLHALQVSGTERGYPPSAGGPGFRRAAAGWMKRRFNVTIDPDTVVACVGTKELVASTSHYLRLHDPKRDTVLYPAISYPTYAMSASLAAGRAVGVPPANPDGSGLDFSAIDKKDAARAMLLWVNSPGNPTGGLTDLKEAARWGRRNGVPVFSDECYTEFTWEGEPRSILQTGVEGVVAVHSLSKRSNLAGLRAGFYAGDPDIVSYLRSVRQHAGLMMPGPVQAAAAVALADDEHVMAQRERYQERLAFMAETFKAAGCPVELPAGGFYLWVPVPVVWTDADALAMQLAKDGGLLVSPGELYGEAGKAFVRVAVVQPMEKLRLVAERLASAGWE